MYLVSDGFEVIFATQLFRSIDGNLFFFKLKLANNDKTKVRDKFIFHSVSLVLLPNTMSKLIDNWIEYM